MSWFGYRHQAGHYKLKHYSPAGLEAAQKSSFVAEIFGPWECSRAEAEQKLKKISTPPIPFLPYKMNEGERLEAQLSAEWTLLNKIIPKEVPPEFQKYHNPFCDLASTIFFRGGDVSKWEPVEGVDKLDALRCFRAVLASFAPSSEQKMAVAGYMLSTWFDHDSIGVKETKK